MPGPASFRRLLRLSRGGRDVESSIDDELRFHIETRADDLIASGMSRDAALARAREEFGDVSEARRELAVIDRRREASVARAEWWDGVMHDARIAMRSLRRQPMFAGVVLITLAIGIGANTAMFSVVNTVLLRPLPYPEPDRLVLLWETHRGDVSSRSEASYPDYVDWRAERSVFTALEGYEEGNVTVSDASGAEQVRAGRVTSGFFPMLGVTVRGRGFTAADDAPGGTQAVVLSHAFWLRRFGGDEGVIGRTLGVNGFPCEIRGVLPPSFTFAPTGDAEVWVPIGRSAETRAQRFNHWFRAIGRLQPGVTIDMARRRMGDVMTRLAVEYPESNAGRGIDIRPLREAATGEVQRPLLVLFGAVALVLLIACANIASLVLARSVERGREIAVRAAIGASRARVMQQLLTENLVLALLGGALGAWVAVAGVRFLVAAAPASVVDMMPALRGTTVDPRALAFAILVATLTGIVFGLGPAMLASRSSAAELLRSGTRGGAGRHRQRFREGLVVTEIALTLILLVAAGLMGRSLAALLRVDPGFTTDRVAIIRLGLVGPAYTDVRRQPRFFEDLLERVRALSEVEAAGAISRSPLQGSGTNLYHVEGTPEPLPANRPEAATRAVAGDYFQTLRIPIVEGRVLNARDDLTAPYALVMNQSLARRLFGSRSAIGRKVRFYAWQDSAWTIVGVVGDVKTDALDQPVRPTFYYSHLQGPENRMSVVVRGRNADARTLIEAMKRIVHDMDPSLPVYGSGSMSEFVSRTAAVNSRRYILVLLAAFAVTALLLAIIGVYGVIAYAVTQRTREIAIRMALGARASSVIGLILRNGVRLVLVGAVAGAIAALAVSRTLSSLLFGVKPGDATTYAVVAIALAIAAMAASYIPARRAARMDPATALRAE